MMIYVRDRSKRKKKVPAKQQAEYQQWLDSLKSIPLPSAGKKKKAVVLQNTIPKLTTPPGRETKHYPSLSTSGGVATKPNIGKVYTGTAMKGIGTLHKSNAVPIFTDEEARDQAAMRR